MYSLPVFATAADVVSGHHAACTAHSSRDSLLCSWAIAVSNDESISLNSPHQMSAAAMPGMTYQSGRHRLRWTYSS